MSRARSCCASSSPPPPPLGLPVKHTTQGFHRDIYYDTADGSLSRRDVVCRFRLGSDDRRVLTVMLRGSREWFASRVTELDLRAALAGESEAARRLRGLVDPAIAGAVGGDRSGSGDPHVWRPLALERELPDVLRRGHGAA